jgi:transcription antitermination factor NusG
MDLELTGRSCIRSTMTKPITIDSEPTSLTEDAVQNEMFWYAGYTASRHEKRVAEHFTQRGVEHFLPLYETIHRWNNGRHRIQLPLFPGYIFVHIALRDRMRVIEVPGFVRLVGFSGLPVPLPESGIVAMRKAMAMGINAQPHPYLTAGSRVEVVRGPFQGMRGILLRRRGKCHFVLSLDLIMRSMAVDVDACDVIPVHSSDNPRSTSRNVAIRSW